jgi:hypothetical protein
LPGGNFFLGKKFMYVNYFQIIPFPKTDQKTSRKEDQARTNYREEEDGAANLMAGLEVECL